jgi:3-deoxy-D-manno-octulosonic acid (KDO) 8-phosphate synthase
MEVHDNPNKAKSDAACQWPLEKLDHLLKSIKRVKQAVI